MNELAACEGSQRTGAFPWGYADDFLSPSDLEELSRTFLDPATHPDLDTLGRGKQRVMFRVPPLPPVVDDAGPAWSAAIAHLASIEQMTKTWDWITREYRSMDIDDPDYAELVEARCRVAPEDLVLQIEFSSMSDGAWLPPHTDAPPKVLSCVLYLSEGEWDPAWGGSTVVYQPTDPRQTRNWGNRIRGLEEMEVVEAVPFRNNRMFWFIKTAESWHGVTPVTAPPGHTRRSFNVSVAIRPEAMERPDIVAPLARIKAREDLVFA